MAHSNTGDDDDSKPTEIDLTKSGDGTETEDDDRGDEVGGKIDKAALEKVAGEETTDTDKDGGDEDGEGDKDGDKTKPPETIKYQRFAKVVDERNELRAENERLKKEAEGKGEKAKEGEGAKEKEQPAFDEDAKEREYLEKLAAGDDEGALAVRKEINAHLKASAKAEALQETQEVLTKAELEREFNKAVKQVKKEHPWLDENSPEADEDSIDMVVALRDQAIRKGKAPHEALKDAVARVAKVRPKGDADGDDKDGGDGKDGDDSKAGSEADRKAAAIQRGVDANNAQPPANAGGKGDRAARTSQLDIENMSEADFDKLPDAEKRRLRGDAG